MYASEGAAELCEAARPAPGDRTPPRHDPSFGVPAFVKYMHNPNDPEVLAVIPLLSPEQRRRREIMLTRVMLLAVDHVLSGEPLGLETARDLIREVQHAYPELVADKP